MKKRGEKEIIKNKEAYIMRDKQQMRVGIPSDIASSLEINPKEDSFLWSIVSNKSNEISLEGHLIKGGRKNEKIEDK